MSLDYYDLLGLKRDCLPDEIARAYRTLSLKWHPKLSKEDAKTAFHHFSQISESFEVLSDRKFLLNLIFTFLIAVKRAFFDKYGEKLLKEGFFNEGLIEGGYQFGGNPEQIFIEFFEKDNPFAKIYDNDGREMFGSMFGSAFGGQNFPGLPPVKDLIIEVECTLNELYSGCMKEVKYMKTLLNNDGRTTRDEMVTRIIDIKSGYDNCSQIIIKGEGNESNGKKPSDLIFKVKEVKHQDFERKGNDLIFTAKVNLIQALCSETVRIITLDGRKLLIGMDEIIGPKTLKKIAGEGMPIYKDEEAGKMCKGNLYIKFDIEFPEVLDQEAKEAVIELLKNS